MATYHFSNKPHATLKSGQKMNVKTHFEYICREGKYSHMRDRSQEKLVLTSFGNMPAWSYNEKKGKLDAQKFWTEDEKNRGTNGRGYREIQLALMEEFTDEENRELVETFLQRSKIKDNHAYSYAIHDKPSAFNKEHRNIHAHIMFNEKIIEHDRPLSADTYFKKYSVKKDLTPVGGYKVSRYYSSREATIDMRQLWEDIVNEKFKEKQLPQRVSCKTLKEQKLEAEENQDYLTASFLDRESAPIIGSSYRNPKTMKHIQDLVHGFTEAMQDSLKDSEMDMVVQNLENDEKERSLILFAQDLALRNMAKAIEQERKNELEEAKQRAIEAIQKKEKEEAIAEIEEAPWAVTIQDIKTFIKEKQNEAKDRAEKLFRKFDMLYVPEITKEKAVDIAMNDFTNGKYDSIKKELQLLNDKYIINSQEEIKFLQDKSFGAAERYGTFLKERRSLKEQIDAKEKELNDIEILLSNPANEDKLQESALTIWNDYLKKKKERDDTLTEMNRAENESATLQVQYNSLNNEIPDQLLFISGSPAMTTRKDKLRGTIPLRELITYVSEGKQYLVINKDNEYKPKAIRLNEQTENGSAKIYELTLKQDNISGRKRIESVTETENYIPLYQSYSTLLEAINKLPEELAPYKKKLEEIRRAVELEYNKMFKPEEQSYIKEKETEHTARNKDPDMSI